MAESNKIENSISRLIFNDFEQCAAQWQQSYVVALITSVLVTWPGISHYQSRLDHRTLTHTNTDYASSTKASEEAVATQIASQGRGTTMR